MSRRHVARSVPMRPDPSSSLPIGALLAVDGRLGPDPVPSPDDPLACLAQALDPSTAAPSAERGPAAWIATLLAGAVEAIPGVGMGSVAEATTRSATIWASTLPVAAELDRRGAEWGEGPCAEALRARTPSGTVTVARLDGPVARRWPRWSTRARAAGVAATLSVVLPGAPRKRPAVLALHGHDASAFGPAALAAARAFAAPLALAVQAVSRVAGLEQALETRDVIGRAKGVLMARCGVDDRAAFDQLVAVSQHSNVRLAEVAAWIVDDLDGGVSGSARNGSVVE